MTDLKNGLEAFVRKQLPTTGKFDRGKALGILEKLAQLEFSPSQAEVALAEGALWKKSGKKLLKSGLLDNDLSDDNLLGLITGGKVGTLECLGAMFVLVKGANKMSELHGSMQFTNAFKSYMMLNAAKGEGNEMFLANFGLRDWSAGFRIGRVADEFIDLIEEADKLNDKLATA